MIKSCKKRQGNALKLIMNYELWVMRCNFLTAIFVVMACFSLHAAESDCHSALDPVKACHCGLDPQSPFIYIAENAKIYNAGAVMIYKADDAKIYDNDLLFAKQSGSNKTYRKGTETNKVAAGPAETDKLKQEPLSVVFPVFPFAPSSSTFLQGGRELATISLQPKYDRQQPAAKTCRENTYRRINNADLSLYHLKQRQKLSTAATQCGMLTSFASTSPPAIKSLSLRAWPAIPWKGK